MFRFLMLGLAAGLSLATFARAGAQVAGADCAIVSLLSFMEAAPAADQFRLTAAVLEGIDIIDVAPSGVGELGIDAALVLAWPAEPFMVALVRGECVVAILRIERRALWTALLRAWVRRSDR